VLGVPVEELTDNRVLPVLDQEYNHVQQVIQELMVLVVMVVQVTLDKEVAVAAVAAPVVMVLMAAVKVETALEVKMLDQLLEQNLNLFMDHQMDFILAAAVLLHVIKLEVVVLVEVAVMLADLLNLIAQVKLVKLTPVVVLVRLML
tara:strand:- start:23 stop:460 length:438 start_codon:yes stop_codon:yes gene_type:complete